MSAKGYFYHKGKLYPNGGGPDGCPVHGWNPKTVTLPSQGEDARFCWEDCDQPGSKLCSGQLTSLPEWSQKIGDHLDKEASGYD